MIKFPFGRKGKAAGTTQNQPARRVPYVRRVVNEWWERLYALVFGRVPVGEQAQLYSSHDTTRDYVWNTIGQTLWGSLLPILTIVATQLVGAEEAGRFNLAFTIATLLLTVLPV